jgi:hypothetical protein
LNPAGVRDLPFWSSETFKYIRYQQHLDSQLKPNLNASTGAAFFLGVSGAGVNISTSALFFFVPTGLVYRVIWRSILHGAVRLNMFHRLYFVVAQAAGIASFGATAQQKV